MYCIEGVRSVAYLIVFNKWCQILDNIGVIELLKRNTLNASVNKEDHFTLNKISVKNLAHFESACEPIRPVSVTWSYSTGQKWPTVTENTKQNAFLEHSIAVPLAFLFKNESECNREHNYYLLNSLLVRPLHCIAQPSNSNEIKMFWNFAAVSLRANTTSQDRDSLLFVLLVRGKRELFSQL